MGLYSLENVKRIIAETGSSACHYCRRDTRIRYMGPAAPDHATIDHVVPKSRGGSNDPSNLVLACNACNNAKADRSYDDFVARPYQLPRAAPERHREDDGKPVRIRPGARVIVPICKPKKPVEHPAMKIRNGTLAAAILSGEINEGGFYQGTPQRDVRGEPRNRIAPMPYHETMYILTGKKVPKRSEIFDPR